MVLGLKNWRIFAACALLLCGSLLIPGSLKWFSVIANIYPGGYTPIYLWLKEYSIMWFLCYAGGIAGITALIVFRSRGKSYPMLASFAVPAMFLTMPLEQYYHFTILMFPFMYLSAAIPLSDISKKSNNILITCIIVTIMLIQFQLPFSGIIGLFLLWSVLAFQLAVEIKITK